MHRDVIWLHSNYPIKRSNSLSELIVFRLPVPCEIDRPWGDVHVHDPVDDLRLEVALVLVDHVLLASVEQLREVVLVLRFFSRP